jgi:RNase P protein component
MPGFSITAVPPHAAAQHIKFKLPLERQGQMKPPRQESMTVGVFAMASIKRTSKLAVERKRCQRKLKTAMDLIVNRGAGLPVHENGWDLVSQG